MSDSVAVKEYMHRSHDVEAFIEGILLESRIAERAHELGVVIPSVVGLLDLTDCAWRGLLKMIFDEEMAKDSVIVEKVFRDALSRTADTFQRITRYIADLHGMGYSVENETEFTRALTRLETIRQEVARTLPDLSPQMIAQGRLELQQNLGEELESFLERIKKS
jgi:hypothetical protein